MTPSDPHPTADADSKGRAAEKWMYEDLRSKRESGEIRGFISPDWLVFDKWGGVYAIEVKGQDLFTPPPFAGHGLPVAQAEGYKMLREATGIETDLVVKDGNTVFVGRLHLLEQGPVYDTPGTIKYPRRIYGIDGFEAHDLGEPTS